MGGDNPYVYAGNNPLSNVDPSGQRAAGANAAQVKHSMKLTAKSLMLWRRGNPPKYDHYGCLVGDRGCDAGQIAADVSLTLSKVAGVLAVLALILSGLTVTAAIQGNPLMAIFPVLLFLVLGPLSTAIGAGMRVGSLAAVAILGTMALANIQLQRQALFG